MSSGPVQLMAFGYGSGTDVEEQMLAQLDALEGRGIIRVLDFLFVQKTGEDEVDVLDVGDDEDYGAILSGFLGGDDDESAGDHLAELVGALEVGSAMALVLVEHQWAAPLFVTVDNAGGVLLSEGFITEDDQLIMGAEVEAVDEAAEVIAAAQAAEAAAVLEALQAVDDAASAVAAANAVRTAAAAEAVSALIEAGFIEERAAHEAAEALAEAGLIEDAALAEAAGVVADAQTVEEAAAEEAALAIDEAEQVVERADEIEVEAAEEAEAAVDVAAAVEESAAQKAAEAVVGAGLVEQAAIEEAEEVEGIAANAEAIASLTPAEKRVLRYLGTDLTFAAIADKLHLSRGAVKSRAASIYRKLDVNSRAEAAEVAAAAKAI